MEAFSERLLHELQDALRAALPRRHASYRPAGQLCADDHSDVRRWVEMPAEAEYRCALALSEEEK